MRTILLFITFISITEVAQSQYTIPYASQQPSWVFPIWIENGDGQRDTIYIGYDSTASWQGWLPQDSIFGAKSIVIDSSKFNACFRYSMYADTALKVIVCSLNSNNLFPESSVGQVSFIHAIYPLKFSWDVSLLKSDSLPFTSQTLAPPAQAEIYFEMGTYGGAYTNDSLLCSTSNTLLISDTIQPTFNYCYAEDSVRFQDMFNTPGAEPGYIIIVIKTWMGEVLNLATKDLLTDFIIFPNPFSSEFYITLPEKIERGEIYLRLFNSIGELVCEIKPSHNIDNTITLYGLVQSGLYFLEVNNRQGFLSRQILIKQ